MRTSIASAFLGLALATACGSDGGSSADGGVTADSASTADAASATTGVISGIVVAADDQVPIAGAIVAVVGTNIMATTDALGVYSLEAPVGPTFLRTTAAESWSSIGGLDHTTAEVTDFNFYLVSNLMVAQVDDALLGGIDPAKGIIYFNFATDNAGGGESATVTPAGDGSFTFNSKGTPVEEPNLQAGGEAFLAVYGVTVGTPTLTVTGASGVNTCAMAEPTVTDWPVEAATFTYVNAICTPL